MDPTLKLFPGHPHPAPDELLSAWMRRTAHANATDMGRFASRFHVKGAQFDVDRKLTPKVAHAIAEKTVVTPEEVHHLSVLKYVPALCSRERMQGKAPHWILPFSPHVERRASLDFYPDVKPAAGGFYYPYCPDCFSRGQEYIRRIWRLAFVTVCPLHGTPLLNYDAEGKSESEGADREKGPPLNVQRLLSVQAMLLRALHTGRAPEAFRDTDGHRLSASHFFAGVRRLMLLFTRPSRGLYARSFVEERAGVTFPSGSDLPKIEHGTSGERRYLMQLLSWLLSDWPEGFEEMCLRCGVKAQMLRHYGKGKEKSKWLPELVPPRERWPDRLAEGEKTELGTRSDRIQGLALSELLKLDPDLELQLGLIGVEPSEIASLVPTDRQWQKVRDVFYSYSRHSYGTKGLIRRRTLFGLLLLVLRREDVDAKKLPPLLSQRVRNALSSWTRDGRLEAAFSRLGRTLDPKGQINWQQERERLDGKEWAAEDHYSAADPENEVPDPPSGTKLIAGRRVFLKGGTSARLRPSYFHLSPR